jgi:hypothetical protein
VRRVHNRQHFLPTLRAHVLPLPVRKEKKKQLQFFID